MSNIRTSDIYRCDTSLQCCFFLFPYLYDVLRGLHSCDLETKVWFSRALKSLSIGLGLGLKAKVLA